MVPNLYTLLSAIPEPAKYFSVIDLKAAFYSLTEASQFLFAFEDLTQTALGKSVQVNRAAVE